MAKKAFKLHYATLVLIINEAMIPVLAGHLYSEGVVSRLLMQKLTVLGLSSCEKSILILNEVEDQISSNVAVFSSFISALQTVQQLKELAIKLIKSYRKFQT